MVLPKSIPHTNNATLWLLAFIMLVNAMAYGVIIPLLYPYAERFGINPVGLSLLFASFSFAQFIATPILGRLSDRFGRKPVLLFCFLGTSISLALFASATSMITLFIARIVDGVTGGNISVAQAMIADSTKGNERAKAFALLSAAFGVGFLVGPTLGGLMSTISITAPFWFSSALALIGTLLGVVILRETLPAHHRQASYKPLFDFKHLAQALFLPLTGTILAINFISSIAQNAFIIGAQSFTNDVLRMTPTQIGLMFGAIGLINIFTQAIGIRVLLNKVSNRKLIVVVSIFLSSISLMLLAWHQSLWPFLIDLMIFSVVLSPIGPIVTGLLSERVKAEDQGGILGINQSYTSLGQIIGPLMAGLVAARLSIPSIFVMSGAVLMAGFFASLYLKPVPAHKFDL